MTLLVNIQKTLKNFTLTANFETDEAILAILGESGAGKSLLLKCIAGIETPDSGKIVLGGRVLFDSEKHINLPPQKRKVGYLFQNYALFPNMTVEQNIKVTAKNPDSAVKYMNQFGLTGKENCFPSFLSGGEQQRVALARLLASEPEVFLFDEPFSALDNHRKAELERLLLDILEEKNLPAILVTHDRNEAFRLSNKIAAMEKGTLARAQEKHVFFEKPKSLAEARLTGCKNATRIQLQNGKFFAVDWGIPLTFSEGNFPKSSVSHAAFRAHYFVPASSSEEENTFTCDIKRVIEDTFSFIICFTQKGNAVNTKDSLLCWEVTKEQWKEIEARAKSGTLCARLDVSKLMLFEGESE